MKTSILFSAILFISTASFAQTSVTSQAAVKEATTAQASEPATQLSSQGSGSSTTTLQSNAINNADNQAHGVEKAKTEAATAKTAAKNEIIVAKTATKKAVATDANASANIQAGSTASAGLQDNKTAGNTALKGNASLSTKAMETTGNRVKQSGEKAVIKTKAVAAKTVNVKPVSVKANTHIKAVTGIKIK